VGRWYEGGRGRGGGDPGAVRARLNEGRARMEKKKKKKKTKLSSLHEERSTERGEKRGIHWKETSSSARRGATPQGEFHLGRHTKKVHLEKKQKKQGKGGAKETPNKILENKDF